MESGDLQYAHSLWPYDESSSDSVHLRRLLFTYIISPAPYGEMIAPGTSRVLGFLRYSADHSISENGNGSIMRRYLCWNKNAIGNEGDIRKVCNMRANPPCTQGYFEVFQKCMQGASLYETYCTLIFAVDILESPPVIRSPIHLILTDTTYGSLFMTKAAKCQTRSAIDSWKVYPDTREARSKAGSAR